MNRFGVTIIGAGMALLAAGAVPASGADPISGPPDAFKRLLDCRALTGDAARLSCYDAQMASFGTAVEKQDIVIADRGQLRKARRSLFGLTLPNLDLFGTKDGPEKAEMSEISATLTAARVNGDRRWMFVLDDGARWIQADTKDLPRDPRPGMPIKIRRAAMGSYLANIDGQIAIRVRREN